MIPATSSRFPRPTAFPHQTSEPSIVADFFYKSLIYRRSPQLTVNLSHVTPGLAIEHRFRHSCGPYKQSQVPNLSALGDDFSPQLFSKDTANVSPPIPLTCTSPDHSARGYQAPAGFKIDGLHTTMLLPNSYYALSPLMLSKYIPEHSGLPSKANPHASPSTKPTTPNFQCYLPRRYR